MQIEVADAAYKPGDTVFVPVRGPERTKPEKVLLEAMLIAVHRSGKTKVSYLDGQGNELTGNLYSDPWTCDEAIEILERHKRQANEELEKLKEKQKTRRTQ